MAKENRFRKGSKTRDSGCTHGSVSEIIKDVVAWSNRLGSTIWSAGDAAVVLAATTACGATTKADAVDTTSNRRLMERIIVTKQWLKVC